MVRAAVAMGFVLLTACDEVTVVALGANDGVLPIWYEDYISDLPKSYRPEEIPDGRYELLSRWSPPATLVVVTREDGGRDVAIGRSAPFVDEETAAAYRDVLGEDLIGSVRGVDLQLTELELTGVDLDRTGPADVAASGMVLTPLGVSATLPDEVWETLRDELLAGQAVSIPISLTFHLPPERLDALPTSLHVFILAQPTLYVDAIEAL